MLSCRRPQVLFFFSIPNASSRYANSSDFASISPYRFDKAMDPVEEAPATWRLGCSMALSRTKKPLQVEERVGRATTTPQSSLFEKKEKKGARYALFFVF